MTQTIPFHFSDYLSALENIAQKSGSDRNSSINFYKSEARTILFKLEALSRIFKSFVDKNTFSILLKEFKEAEDQLGKYDYHEALYLWISTNKNSPQSFINYFNEEKENSFKLLQGFLQDKKWLSADSGIYKDFHNKVNALQFPSDEETRKNLGKYIIKQLEKIIDGYENGKLDPNDIEEGLHEIRRKLRWVSIYAQACDGWIQLKTENSNQKELAVYLTDEVIKSPFNKLPPTSENINPLTISSTYFYALSWIIAELGKLKDEGLQIMAVNRAIKSLKISDKEELTKIFTLYNASESKLSSIPQQAKIILDDFINKHKIPQQIIRDIKRSL